MAHQINRAETIGIVVIFTTFMGQIYLTPFDSNFRLTFAVVVLNILMIHFEEIKPIPTINLVGLCMFLVRSFVHAFTENIAITEAFSIYYPVFFFYIFYALFFVYLGVRSLVKKPLSLFIALWICDSVPNLIELMVRREWHIVNLESAVYTIIVIALFRTLLTVFLIYASMLYRGRLRDKVKYASFVEKINLISNLKTELFFLKKSKNDIEETMKQSYFLYEQLSVPLLKDSALSIARDIHEIKKDYLRVIAGIERTIEEAPFYEMSLTEIVDIVIDTQSKVSKTLGKKIKFIHNTKHPIKTVFYCELISIINNLVHNAIDAIPDIGFVKIDVADNDDFITIDVIDTGKGITADEIPLIFEPGYSTKYNKENGIMSSGIGLTHVKYLVKHVFDGTIDVTSDPKNTTTFTMQLKKKLVEHFE